MNTKHRGDAKPRRQILNQRIPLESILQIVDWQIDFYEGDDRQSLIKASNTIYDHLHKDDPEEQYGN